MTRETDLDTHLRVLSVLSLVLGGLMAAMVLVMLAFMSGFAWSGPGRMGGLEAGMMTLVALALVSVVTLLLATGLGLHRRASWARPVGFTTCALALFNFPIGTAFGIYGLWVLTRPCVDASLQAS